MSRRIESGGRFIQFWTTVPGVLTAIAAVITAVGSIYFAGQGGKDDDPPPTDQPTVIVVPNLAGGGETAPDVDELNLNSLSLDEVPEVTAADPGAEFDQSLDACAAGDEVACAVVVDQLVDECAQGYGLSCDALYLVGEPGSDVEVFGGTCGGRFDFDEVAGACSDL